MNKLLIPCLYMLKGQAVTGFGQKNCFGDGNLTKVAKYYSDNGADELLVFDFSNGDAEHEEAIGKIKEICDAAEVPVIGAGNIKRMEDVKKLVYAGCAKAVLNASKAGNMEIMEEVSKKFGKEKIMVSISDMEEFTDNQVIIENYAGSILLLDNIQDELIAVTKIPMILHTNHGNAGEMCAQLQKETILGISGEMVSKQDADLMGFKRMCKEQGVPVNTFESAIPWSEFKLNADGMVPIIVQDYKTDEVLMLAYMNEAAYEETLRTGKMTYWSRSRDELWTKGLTSGHLQYVKELRLDCDNDTVLAKVSQIGAACHTGSRSCFFKPLVKKEYDDTNPLRVFQDVYDVILDRKVHPKEGSYTNYLFDKGIDKILKKVGEECTEIVIAAKNPDKEEIKYEISDFLYHAMVLMAEKGVTWEDITKELAHR
ncbi:MAG: bifunctional phosphoribosyl-AMP cyclohydrolase/phosphoribosyl-ATP diphosphatase HisIE [Lachnospiraceae bacterium]|nr:bifunctional phosphoribosyl-AMP cyclohydrolase/phosphoribosyl-ATP diphosphatase HisIE [Lachnospiraceae bacterium]